MYVEHLAIAKDRLRIENGEGILRCGLVLALPLLVAVMSRHARIPQNDHSLGVGNPCVSQGLGLEGRACDVVAFDVGVEVSGDFRGVVLGTYDHDRL